LRWFFYGTLLDPEILAIVLGRPVDPAALIAADIAGYRRVAVRGEVYPALIPAPGATVAGAAAVFDAASDEARLRYYEGDEYDLVDVAVSTADGDLPARAFIAGDGMTLDKDTDWTLAQWRADGDRAVMIDQARRMMTAFADA